MKKKKIARVCHEVNRAYCLSIGDDSQVSWEEAEQWQRDSAIAGVLSHMDNPDMTPAESHAAWLEHKTADGWKHGPEKDVDKKQHPCMMPYDYLPAEQKAKDYIFSAIVHELTRGKENG